MNRKLRASYFWPDPPSFPSALDGSFVAVLVLFAMLFGAGSAWAIDEAAAEALMRKSDCFKCHSVTRRKDGPSYKEIAEKYRNRLGGEQKLTTHITTAPSVKLDGADEDHQLIKSKNPDEIKSVVKWILSR